MTSADIRINGKPQQLMKQTWHTLIALLFVFASASTTVNGQSGNYRSNVSTSGYWDAVESWQTWNGSAWVAAASVPTGDAGVNIAIQTGQTITLTSAKTLLGSLTVTGALSFSGSGVLTVGSGGTLQSAGTVNGSSSTLIFNSGGTYQHNRTTTAGTIPTATWNAGSTCAIIGYTSNNSTPGGVAQSFYNFTWNCPNQSYDISLGGNPTTIRGDMSIVSTGAGQLQLKSSDGTATTTVSGDYNQSGGTFVIKSYGSGTETLTVKGFSLTGGTFIMTAYGASILNVGRDFVVTGAGLFTRSGTSTATVNFNGSGPQSFTMSGSMQGTIDYTVNNGATLLMGSYPMTGGGSFTLSPGAGLGIGHANGINGNIAVTGSKAISTGADYIYNGTTAQAAGALLPATINSLTVNNTVGSVTLSQVTTVTTSVTLAGGAKLSLPKGTSTTATLVIAGVTKRRGVWGSSDSSAANQDTHFAGPGVLNVTAGPTSSPSSTTLVSSSNPSAYGSPVTFTATVTGSGPMPTGTVTFKEGSTTLGTGPLDSSGAATFVTSSLLVAGSPHSITAVYTGDANFDGSTSSAVLQTVNKADPSVTAWPTAAAIIYGQTLANSTLSGGSATPVGTFAFTTPSTTPNAGTALQSVTYTPNDTANYNPASTTVSVTVNPLVVTLAGTRAYDGTTTAAAGILSVVNKVGSDDVMVASGSGTLSGKDAGSRAIASVGTLGLGGTAAGNYTLIGASSSVTISPAALAITANSDTKTYGDTRTYGSGSTAFTSTGLQNGENVGSVTVTASGGTADTAPVGDYTLTPTAAAGGTFSLDNYSITYRPGTLRVFPRLSGSSASASLSGYKGGHIRVRFVAKDADGNGLATNEVQLATADGGSSFAYSIGVPPDTAILCLKPRFFLRGSIPVPAAVRSANEVPLTITNMFKGGDADNNNQVDGTDYAWLRYYWFQDAPQYDLNGDGIINADDYALLKGGWYQKGEDE
jgi:hypothetical protein